MPRKMPGEVADTYLGMLYPTEDYKVYGCASLARCAARLRARVFRRCAGTQSAFFGASRYTSNTRIKFILVVDNQSVKDEEMRMVS